MARIQPPTIQIAPERLTQLKELKEALGNRSIGETIAHLINQEISLNGTIADTIPGVVIDRKNDTVVIGVHKYETVEMSLSQAADLAHDIKEMAKPKQKRFVKLTLYETDAVRPAFSVERVGSAVKVTLANSNLAPKTFNVDLALDFARLIEKAIA